MSCNSSAGLLKTNMNTKTLKATVLAIVITVVGYGAGKSQEPANPQNAIAAWTVANEGQFRPGYYYWPAFGQKPSDAKYCATADDFNKMNVQVTGKPKWPMSPQSEVTNPPPQPPPENVPPATPRPKSSMTSVTNLIVIGLVIVGIIVAIRLASSAPRKGQVPPKLRVVANQQSSPTGKTAGEPVNPPPIIYDPDEHSVTELVVSAVEPAQNVNARLVLTNRSMRIFPDVESPNQTGLFWRIPLADIVQAHINYGSAASPRMIIVSKVCVCSPVSYGVHQDGLFGSGWMKANKLAIERGEIAKIPQKWGKVQYGGGNSPWLERKERVTGYFCYRKPEGFFFDPPGHCFCFQLGGKTPEFAGKLFAQIIALRGGNGDSQSYKSADESRSTAPWFFNDEKPEYRWQGKAAPQGVAASLMRGLFGLAGAFASSEGMRSPGGLLPKPLSTLWIYLTNRRLIIEAAGEKEVEVADYPRDCVRALQWNTSSDKAMLEVFTVGPWTQSNSTNPQKKGTPGTGPSLNLPTSHLAAFGGWEGFLTGHYGRQFVVFDSRPPDVKNLVDTLNAVFH